MGGTPFRPKHFDLLDEVAGHIRPLLTDPKGGWKWLSVSNGRQTQG